MFHDELIHFLKVFAYITWHDMEATSQCQNRIEVFDMCVETETSMMGNPVVFVEGREVNDRCDEIAQSRLVQHRPFRFSRRAAGMYQHFFGIIVPLLQELF